MDSQTYFAVMELFRAVLKVADFNLHLKAGVHSDDACIDVRELDIILSDADIIDNIETLLKEIRERLNNEENE